MRYRYTDQTSDLGLEIFGKDLPELFGNACFAMFDNMLHLGCVVAREARTIELESESLEALFLDWLRELLFRFSTEYFIVKEVVGVRVFGSGDTIPSRSGSGHVPGSAQTWRLKAEVRGEKLDPARHKVKTEIKTPTYHMFEIVKDESGYKATVVFDV